jgi:hypothetical protein
VGARSDNNDALPVWNKVQLQAVSIQVEKAAAKLLKQGIYKDQFGELADETFQVFMSSQWVEAT